MKYIILLIILFIFFRNIYGQIIVKDLDNNVQNNYSNYTNFFENSFTQKTSNSYVLYNNFPLIQQHNGYLPKTGVNTVNADSDPELEIAYGVGTTFNIINTDGSIVNNWYKSFAPGQDVIWAPAIGDIDGDMEEDVVFATGSFISGQIHAYDIQGNVKSGFPINNMGVMPMMPVLCDIDQDGTMEIIASKRISSVSGEIWIIKGDGSIFPGWPINMGEYPASAVACGDIDNDGIVDIVAESRNKLWVWNKDGVLRNGFPFDLDSLDITLNSYSSPVIVDIDQDLQHEIIFCAHEPGGIIYILKNDGSLYPGWPKYTDYWIFSPPIVSDIDGDGNFEIFVGDQIASSVPLNHIYGYDRNGNILPGFPFGPTFGVYNQLTLADLDGDNDFEIIFDQNIQYPDTTGIYSAIHHDGIPFSDFPLNTLGNTFFNQLVLEDVTLNGSIDFIGQGNDLLTNQNYIHVWSTSIPWSNKIMNPYYNFNKQHDGYIPLLITSITNNKPNLNSTLSIYPNPTTDFININSSVILGKVYSLSGTLLLQTTKNIIQVESLPKGTYILEIVTKTDIIQKIFIKE